MKRFLSISLSLLVFAIVGSSHSTGASDCVSLFNRQDLSGWKNNGQEKRIVQDGTILSESTAGKYGYLTTEKALCNFDLRRKFKPEASGNSGVFLRSKLIGIDSRARPRHRRHAGGSGPQPDIGKYTRGLYAMPTEAGQKLLKPGGWNDLEIFAHGNHLVTKLNRAQIVDFAEPAQNFSDGVVGLQIRPAVASRCAGKTSTSERNEQHLSGSS